MSRLDPEYEMWISPDEAGDLLQASLEPGDLAHTSYVLHIGNRTVFINSESPIEFAIPHEEVRT